MSNEQPRAIILSIDLPEGTYQIGCFAPNPHNKEPQSAVSANSRNYPDARSIPRTLKPLVVHAIQAIAPQAEDDDEEPEPPPELLPGQLATPEQPAVEREEPDEEPTMYRVFMDPYPGSAYELDGMGIMMDRAVEEVLAVYIALPSSVISELANMVLGNDEQQPADEPAGQPGDPNAQGTV